MKRYHIITFGCQMNEHDSETMAGMLEEMGMTRALTRSEADLVILNTCSVRENADKRFFGTLGQLKNIRESRDGFYVAVCGCMMQQQHIVDTIKEKYPWVDIVFGTHNIHHLPELLNNVINEHEKVMEIYEDGLDIVEGLPAKRLYRHKSFVNITYGCNNFCTYCIVPYTRGRERSRNENDIVNEVRRLVSEGVKEVTLLGQNVNSYRGENTDFPGLIYMLEEVEGLERIRFMTSHPKDLSPALVTAFKECGRLCRHIHLPVQSGSNEILKAMNRRYTREKYMDLVASLRDAVPDIAVTTDIIVGFPGETEKDFCDTLDLAEKVKYDSAFTFLYSIRKGTPAAEYEDQVPEDIKHERFNRLVECINASAAEKNAKYVGRVCDVLVDGRSRNDIFTYQGRTDGFKLVNFRSDRDLTGQIVPVRITGSNTFSLKGETDD